MIRVFFLLKKTCINIIMNSHQLNRYQKLSYEPIYLLDITEETNRTVFQVSGSTANVYKVVIYFNNKTIYCTCPDNTVHCKRVGCICKHCCFVLCKVLRVFDTSSAFFNGRLTFNDTEEQKIRDAIKKVNLTNSDYINPELLDLYKNEETTTTTTQNKDELYLQKRTTTDDDLCAICYDGFTSNVKNVECPACHNVMHKGCIEKWLSMDKKTCVYCRSEVWKNYSRTDATSTAKPSKYKNLRSEVV